VTPILFIALSAWIVYLRVKSAPWQSGVVGLVLLAGAAVYLAISKGLPQHTKIEEDE
jgi:hypothetical protein